jgi:two-component system sensor kinase FixL
MKVAAVSADVGLWRWDLKTSSLWATEHCEEMLGLKAHQSRTLDQLLLSVHAEDREATKGAIAAAISGGSGFEAEYRLVRPDDSISWLSTRGSITRDRNGKPAELMGVI